VPDHDVPRHWEQQRREKQRAKEELLSQSPAGQRQVDADV